MNEIITQNPADQLKDMLMEIGGKIDKQKEEAEQYKEALKKMEEKFGTVESKLSDLESRGIPTVRKPTSVELPIAGTNETERAYFGYNLDMQSVELQRSYDLDAASPKPRMKGYLMYADQEKKDRYAKFLIDLILARVMNDPQAAGRLSKWRDEARKTAMIEGTGGYGGYLVPDEFMNTIIAFARLQSVALRDCTIYPMGTDVKRVPAEDAAVTMTWTAEGVALTESEPTVAEVVLTAKKCGAYSIASNELLADSAMDVVSWITGLYAEALGQEIDNQVFQGTGSPTSGVTTALCGYSVITAGSLSTVTGTNLSSMLTALAMNKKLGAKFYMHREVFHYIRTLKDSNAAFIYNPIGGAQANTVWGYPWEEVEQMPYTDGSNKPIALFGNLRYYILGRRMQNTTLDADPYGAFTTDQTRFRMYWRMAFALGRATAFVRLMTKT